MTTHTRPLPAGNKVTGSNKILTETDISVVGGGGVLQVTCDRCPDYTSY